MKYTIRGLVLITLSCIILFLSNYAVYGYERKNTKGLGYYGQLKRYRYDNRYRHDHKWHYSDKNDHKNIRRLYCYKHGYCYKSCRDRRYGGR